MKARLLCTPLSFRCDHIPNISICCQEMLILDTFLCCLILEWNPVMNRWSFEVETRHIISNKNICVLNYRIKSTIISEKKENKSWAAI